MALVEGTTIYHGPQGVEAATREWLKAWEGARIEAEEFFDAGEQVVAFVHIYARPKHGGPGARRRQAARADQWRCARRGVRDSQRGAQRQVHPDPSLALVGRGPPSRGAGGVGDVARERGGRASGLRLLEAGRLPCDGQ